jgi:hypothetical protein
MTSLPSGYTPPAQREVPAEIFTTAGWIKGSFMLPALRIFTEFANQTHDFFKLKGVLLPGLEQTIPFFALQRDSIIFMIVEPGDGMLAALAGRRQTDISCAFNGGVISGNIDLPQGVRLSDFLLQKAHFFYLTNSTAYLRSGSQSDVRRSIPLALVNSRRVVGISEPRFV